MKRLLFALLLLLFLPCSLLADSSPYELGVAGQDLPSGSPEWALVGSTTAIIGINSGQPQDITLPGSPSSGDLVLVAIAADTTITNQVTTSGYIVVENSPLGGNPGTYVAYKVLTAADSIVTINQEVAYQAAVVQIWRGVDTSTSVDQTWGVATNTNAAPDSPAITTQSANALVISVFFLDDDDTTVSSYPSGYSNGVSGNCNINDNATGATVGISSKIVSSSGSEDPGAYTLGGGNDVWQAGTISFKLGG